jgi:hypothetical protein
MASGDDHVGGGFSPGSFFRAIGLAAYLSPKAVLK